MAGDKEVGPGKKDRREQLLEAALRIISRDGLEGLKYRQLAREAKVPLGSTTYYFSSVQEIYRGAYKLFHERTQSNTDDLRALADRLLLDYFKQGPGDQVRLGTIEALGEAVAGYIEKLVTEDLEDRRIEAAFTHAALLEEAVREPLSQRQEMFLGLSTLWFENFGLDQPEEAAACFVALINHIERQHLLGGKEVFDREKAAKQIRFLFQSLL